MSDDDAPKAPAPADMAWLLTFADLVSLLITFFVLLYSMKTVDESRFAEVRGAMRAAFAEREAITYVPPEDLQSADQIKSVVADQLPYLRDLLINQTRNHSILSQIETEFVPQDNTLRLILPAKYIFADNSIRLSREGKLALTQLADIMRNWDNDIEVAVHTGLSRPYAEPTHWELGMMRAINVAQVMYDRGVAQQVPAVSYGSSRYYEISPYLTELSREDAANRVEITVYGEQRL